MVPQEEAGISKAETPPQTEEMKVVPLQQEGAEEVEENGVAAVAARPQRKPRERTGGRQG